MERTIQYLQSAYLEYSCWTTTYKKENEEHADNKPISFYKQKILPVCIDGTFILKQIMTSDFCKKFNTLFLSQKKVK